MPLSTFSSILKNQEEKVSAFLQMEDKQASRSQGMILRCAVFPEDGDRIGINILVSK